MLNENSYIPVLWSSTHSRIALIYVLLLIMSVLIIYYENAIQPIWFVVIVTISTWYFLTLPLYYRTWALYIDNKFEKHLFWHSLLYRIIASIALIVVAQLTWGRPDYVGAIDAVSYHREAIIIADLIRKLYFLEAYHQSIAFTGQIDNSGLPLFIGMVFAVFGNHYFIGSLALCVISAWGVVFLFRTTKIIWGDSIGRTAGILFMHFPLALFFSVVYRKEVVVVFLLLYIIYVVSNAINNMRLSKLKFIALIAAMSSLFFFRTAVGALVAIVVPVAFIFNKYKGSRLSSIFITVATVIMLSFLIYQTGEYSFFLDRITESGDHWANKRTQELVERGGGVAGYSLAELAKLPVYVIMSIIAPFPAMVDVPTSFGTSHDDNWYYMTGNMVWNILAFFSIIGFYYSIRTKAFQSVIVWAFTAGYIYMLAATVLFTRVRFAYISMPLMLALTALGLANFSQKKYWILYLVAVGIMTIIWNYLRLDIHIGQMIIDN